MVSRFPESSVTRPACRGEALLRPGPRLSPGRGSNRDAITNEFPDAGVWSQYLRTPAIQSWGSYSSRPLSSMCRSQPRCAASPTLLMCPSTTYETGSWGHFEPTALHQRPFFSTCMQPSCRADGMMHALLTGLVISWRRARLCPDAPLWSFLPEKISLRST
jgi:hypothetical protein